MAAPCSYLANRRETRATLERHGLYTKHRLGQNFLVSDDVIAHILALAELTCDDVVVEVGPGIGTLTVALLARVGEVRAIEADRSLAPVLAETCARDGERLTLTVGDALKVLPGGVTQEPQPTTFVANLPYQVAATLILRVLEGLPSVRRLVVMVQAEVADRIAAAPGSKAYGAYTAKLRLWGRVTGRFEVGPDNFMPPPHVDSAVVRIDRAPLLDVVEIPWVAQVIDAAFAQRRKTIRNSLAAHGFERERLGAALAAAGIAPATRAEALAPEDLIRLAEALRHE